MLCFRLLSILFVSSLGYGQLHVITGRATPEDAYTVAATLLKVNGDGTLATVEELSSEKEGMWWIDAADDARIIAMLKAAFQERNIVVVDMDQGKVVKRCEDWPAIPDPDASHIQTWLVGDGTGRLLAGRYIIGNHETFVQAVDLDPQVSCESSFRILGPPDVRSIYVQGSGGAGGATGIEGPEFSLDVDGAVRKRMGSDWLYFGYTVPREYWQDMKVPLGYVWANNSKVLVVSYRDRENEALRRNLAYDKTSRTWSEIPLPNPHVRTFGSVLALSETVKLSAPQKAARAARPELKNDARSRAGFLSLEQDLDLLFPGRLHVYDVATGKRSVIVTNEEDSEVLLVHEDTIYYRVKDSLYSAKLGASGFMPGQKIATDDRILDAHWAFMK